MKKDNESKILIFDIETSPNLGYWWSHPWETHIIENKDEWHILSFSAKWLGEKVFSKGLCDYPLYKKDKESDKALVEDIWKLFDEADIVVAHNGADFDIKKSNSRFSFHKMKPPAPFKTVDTKIVAKKNFAFNSNSLNDLGKYLDLGVKVETGGFKLWLDCMAGKLEAWKKMKQYNANDVILLEKIYLRLLPWMNTHPNLGMYTNKLVCPKCGSGNMQSRGFSINATTKYKRAQCQDCGGWCKVGKNLQILKPSTNL